MYGAFLPRAHDAGAQRAEPDAAVSAHAADPAMPPAMPAAGGSIALAVPENIPLQPMAAATETDAGTPTGADPGAFSGDDPLCLRAGTEAAVCEATRVAAFGRALCSCSGMRGTGSVSTETLGGARRADVGANNLFALRVSRHALPADTAGVIDGALVIGGMGPSAISGTSPEIHGKLELAGDLAFAGDLHVLGSVYSRTYPRGSGELQIDGDLHHDSQRNLTLPSNVKVSGTVIEDDYVSVPPCQCGVSNPGKYLSAIAAAASSDSLSVPTGFDTWDDLTMPRSESFGCGRYVFRNVSSLSSVTWQINGHVVIVVVGDFAVRGDVSVSMAPDAELDLVIGGNLALSGAARFGDPERPGASRIYVRGAVELATNGDPPGLGRPSSAAGEALFVGNLYAPAATLELAPHSDLYGSLFVNQLVVLQSLFVHYDPTVTAKRGVGCVK